jgi:WD40 repeat protein
MSVCVDGHDVIVMPYLEKGKPSIRIYDIHEMSIVKNISVDYNIYDIIFSDKYIVVGTCSLHTLVYNFTGDLVMSLIDYPREFINDVYIYGEKLIIKHTDEFKVWDLESRQCVDEIHSIQLSVDNDTGRIVYVDGRNKSNPTYVKFIICDINDIGNPIEHLELPKKQFRNYTHLSILSIPYLDTFVLRGNYLICSCDFVVYLYDYSTGECISKTTIRESYVPDHVYVSPNADLVMFLADNYLHGWFPWQDEKFRIQIYPEDQEQESYLTRNGVYVTKTRDGIRYVPIPYNSKTKLEIQNLLSSKLCSDIARIVIEYIQIKDIVS